MTKLHLAGRLIAAGGEGPLRYRLLTYGEEGRTSLGKVTIDAGALEIPADVTGLEPVNIEHDGKRPIGRVVDLDQTTEGLEASVHILDTTAGRDVRLEAREGVRAGISVEIDRAVIRAGRLVAGVLTGMGLVTRPAFPSSMLTAADAGDLADEDDDDEEESVDEDTDDDADGERVSEHHDESTSTYTDPDSGEVVTTETTTDQATTVTAPPEENPTMGKTTVNAAGAPAGIPKQFKATDRPDAPSMSSLEHLTASLDNMEDLRGEGRLTAALSNITQTSIYDKTAVPEYVGELWEGRSPVERYAGLVKDNGPLTAAVSKGWEFTQGPQVHPYAGDLAAITSSPVTVATKEIKAERIAGGNRLDRIYSDLPDAGFWDSYLRHSAQDYAVKRDARIGYHIMSNAVASTYDAATEKPAFYNGSLGWAYLIRAARLAMNKVVPNFAIVGADLWEEMALTQRDDALEFLSASLGLDDAGRLDGFRIIGAASDPLTGSDGTSTFDMTGKVLVGTDQTTLSQELPGGPIRVNAEVINNAGVDHGVFGYIKLWTPTKYNHIVSAPAI